MRQTQWNIVQVETPLNLQPYKQGLYNLLDNYCDVLADDFTGGSVASLFTNTAACMPWLWLIVDDSGSVDGAATLTDWIPGRMAYLHGAVKPVLRRHPVVDELARLIFKLCFDELELMKLKAEFLADNSGAKGFCLRMGFKKEARFYHDTRVRGITRDTLLYALTAENARQHVLLKGDEHHVTW